MPTLSRRALLASAVPAVTAKPSKMNVLCIIADDLNDWIGCMGGHPQARTPNLDALARHGVLFTTAQCQAPLCNPSRTSALLGKLPSTTGLYDNSPPFRTAPALRDAVTLPQYFGKNGYRTFGCGKVFHIPQLDPASFEVQGPTPGFGPKLSSKVSLAGGHPLWDWGSPHEDARYGDSQVAAWVSEQLKAKQDRPFFFLAGLTQPHAPWYAPKQFFDAQPLDTVQTAPVRPGDAERSLRAARELTLGWPSPRHAWMQKHDLARIITRAYLAAVSFADAMVGRILDALDQSPYRDNTAVLFFGDNGFHLGERERWGKQSLWEESARVPLIVRMPGALADYRCTQPVGLIDLFPTLVEAAGLPQAPELDGESLMPLLRSSQAARARPALTTYLPGNHALRSEHFRYIRYGDGSEELYDHRTDPGEWFNIAGNRHYASVVEKHRRWLPRTDAPAVPGTADPARFPVPVLLPKQQGG